MSVPARKVVEIPKPDTSLVRRARKVDRILAETYPDARAELDFTNPFECLVVTVVSAQTTVTTRHSKGLVKSSSARASG